MYRRFDPRFPDKEFRSMSKYLSNLKKNCFQSRKALKKANFVKENVNYLVERVNDTNVQFKNLKEEISNLPPSREGTAHNIKF